MPFAVLGHGRVLPVLVLGLVLGFATRLLAQDGLTAAERARIDSAVATVLDATGAPGASIAVVRDGRIAYEHGYGLARLEPRTPVTPAMRFSIGSVSKQFTATGLQLLAEEGRLSLDDTVGKWLPNLTRAGDVTVRQLLSMTAGYQDYWPQDYVFSAMLQPTTATDILDQWARKPLDFDPGTRWQYSNTNYVIAGQILEKVAGMPVLEFLKTRIFTPLGMTSVRDFDAGPLGAEDAAGYLRNALGPLRPAPKEGKGWLFAAGELAMTAHDLALWDISVIDRRILKPASYQVMQTDTRLANGTSTRYGLGVDVKMAGGHRQVAHGGAVSGYLTQNEIYPDDRAAVVVFCNIYPGASDPTGDIASRVASVLFEKTDAETAAALARARRVFEALQKGQIDRTQFSPNANAYFTPAVLDDFRASLGPLGAPTAFRETGQELRGGMQFRGFTITLGARTVTLTLRTLPNGAIEQFLVERAD